MNIIMGPNYYVTAAPQSNMPSRKMLFIGIGLIAAILIGIILMFMSGSKDISKSLQRLNIRIASLQTVLDDTEQTRNIRNQQLSQLISEFRINLASDTNQITPLLISEGMKQEVDQTIAASEADTASTELEEASLNNRLDSAMKDTLQKKIRSIRILLAEIYPDIKAKDLRTAMEKLDTNLSKTSERLDKIKL